MKSNVLWKVWLESTLDLETKWPVAYLYWGHWIKLPVDSWPVILGLIYDSHLILWYCRVLMHLSMPNLLLPPFNRQSHTRPNLVSTCVSVSRLTLMLTLIAGVLQAYCRGIAGVLQEYCRGIAGILQAYCRRIAGVLQAYCRSIAGVLES